MIHSVPSVSNTGFYVIQLQIWKFFNDLIETETVGQKVQNIDHTYTHTPHARPTAALARFNSDSIIVFHVTNHDDFVRILKAHFSYLYGARKFYLKRIF